MAPRGKEENQRIRDERRELILAAASKVFARKGLAAAKIADIAAAAGVSHGLVYHYYASKDEVFQVLTERALAGATMVSRYAQAQPGTPWDKLRWMVATMLDGVRQQPEYFMVAIQALSSDAVPQGLRELAWKQSQVSRAGIVALIAQAQAAGQVAPADPEELATILLSCIHGLATGNAYGPNLFPAFPGPDALLRILKP